MALILYCLLAILIIGLIVAIFLAGFKLGKYARGVPNLRWTPLATSVDTQQYNRLFDKGGYKEEKEIVSDAFSLLLWGLENAEQGRYLISCNQDGSEVEELQLDTISGIRAELNPIQHLERCFKLNVEEAGD